MQPALGSMDGAHQSMASQKANQNLKTVVVFRRTVRPARGSAARAPRRFRKRFRLTRCHQPFRSAVLRRQSLRLPPAAPLCHSSSSSRWTSRRRRREQRWSEEGVAAVAAPAKWAHLDRWTIMVRLCYICSSQSTHRGFDALPCTSRAVACRRTEATGAPRMEQTSPCLHPHTSKQSVAHKQYATTPEISHKQSNAKQPNNEPKQGKARQGKARQGKARQGKARQG
jgi:hypothetical protein